MPIPYAEAGVDKTLATRTCPVCQEKFYGVDHKAAGTAYATHYEKAHA